jgi:hypothetical protein
MLPPYTTPELLTNFTETWITPISGIWTFIAGVGTVGHHCYYIFIDKGRGGILEMLREIHDMKYLDQKRVTLKKCCIFVE